MDKDIKIILVVQILSIILFLKGISATYHATVYSMQNQLWIITKFAFLYKISPLILILPLILTFLTLTKKFNKKTENILIIISLIFLFIGLAIPLILF
jgi:hypothetical protein